jgi:hypothetical protein
MPVVFLVSLKHEKRRKTKVGCVVANHHRLQKTRTVRADGCSQQKKAGGCCWSLERRADTQSLVCFSKPASSNVVCLM